MNTKPITGNLHNLSAFKPRLKAIILGLGLCVISVHCLSQDKDCDEIKKNLGLFGKYLPFGVTVGLNTSIYYSSTGDWYYTLNQNATVTQVQENKNGFALSMVILFAPVKDASYSVVLNIPFKDLKNATTGENGFFNSQTPFGVGFAWFPIKDFKIFGITVIENFGKANKLAVQNTSANPDDNLFFPIANHPDAGLKVDAPVPESLLSPYYQKVNSYSTNIGIIFRL